MNQYTFLNGELSVTAVETKTLSDVYRVIEAGKPQSVVDLFIAQHLSGCDPYQAVKDQWYSATQRIAELEALQVDETITTQHFDDDGNTYPETVVVRAARALTELEAAELLLAQATTRRLETGIETVPVVVPAGIEQWTADEIEAWGAEQYGLNIDKRYSVENILANQIPATVDVQCDGFYPWLATTEWPLHEVTPAAVDQWKAEHYALLRRSQYGSVEAQLDMMYHGTWHDHIAAVKTALPKVVV